MKSFSRKTHPGGHLFWLLLGELGPSFLFLGCGVQIRESLEVLDKNVDLVFPLFMLHFSISNLR